ncbi:MAG TPA: UDP-N-acetylmuramate dehydrogenase [Bacteroidales bacterium]|nr:UDP-N-acetylmuramate dehydrogenase [Bacteroidales bacterium]
MNIESNISLKPFNTFGFDYKVSKLIHLTSQDKSAVFFRSKSETDVNMFIIGGGSNLLFTDDFNGTILHPVFGGTEVVWNNDDKVIISVGSGIKWDDLVNWTVSQGLWGLENLSLIPGDVGASPVQNIGAYGVEVKDMIDKVETIRISDGQNISFSNEECGFRYRYSIFKGEEKGKYLVTRVHYRLSKKPSFNIEYGSLRDEIQKLGKISIHNIRDAVINIRRKKLPDPLIIGNAGSFFKNPVVNEALSSYLKKIHPDLPVYAEKNGMSKLAAGWLIEKCGWKGYRRGDAGVYDKQALILVNYGKASGSELNILAEDIRKSVAEKFSINLEREVETVTSI